MSAKILTGARKSLNNPTAWWGNNQPRRYAAQKRWTRQAQKWCGKRMVVSTWVHRGSRFSWWPAPIGLHNSRWRWSTMKSYFTKNTHGRVKLSATTSSNWVLHPSILQPSKASVPTVDTMGQNFRKRIRIVRSSFWIWTRWMRLFNTSWRLRSSHLDEISIKCIVFLTMQVQAPYTSLSIAILEKSSFSKKCKQISTN